MPYRVINGKLTFVPDDIKSPEEMAQQTETFNGAMDDARTMPTYNARRVVTGEGGQTHVVGKAERAANTAAQNAVPEKDPMKVVPTEQDKINAIANAGTLDEQMAAAREEHEREEQAKKRLANKAFFDSLASTVGALGKFAVVAGSKDGRDVTTGDPAEGSRKAYEEAVKRSEIAKAQMNALDREQRKYDNALAQLAVKMANQRELAELNAKGRENLAAINHGYRMEENEQKGGHNLRAINERQKGMMDAIQARGQNSMAGINARNAQAERNNAWRSAENAATRQHQAEQGDKNRDAAQKRAETNKGRRGGGTRGGTGVNGSTSGGASSSGSGTKKHSHKREESKDF